MVGRFNITLPDLTGHLIFWPLFLAGLAADLWTKNAVFDWLKNQPGYYFPVVDGFVRLVIALNEGAAFGIAAGRLYLLVTISVVAIVVILGIFLFASAQQRIVQAALAFFAAGVCGNLWDRIFNNGLVRDFIDVTYWPGRHWPAFNVADTLLCVGVGLLLIATLFTRRPSCQKRAQPRK
jgi:signal peptidase II